MEIDRNAAANWHHLYVHVPFCRLVCAYCDFVTVGGRSHDIPRYVDALVAELALRPAPGVLRTVSFGGGTPSLLTGQQVAVILAAAVDRWAETTLDEVSLEANPSAREAPDWEGFRAAGVTRVSIGVQSLRDDDLRRLARGHSEAEARAAVRAAQAAGFSSVSIDLIYGIPGQSVGAWRDGLEAAIDMGPDHISCYALQLALEPDEWAAPPRAGALRWRARLAAGQDDGLAAEQYRVAQDALALAGYAHYELSSWARPGHEARHNAAYWARRAYTGIGAGAHSYDGRARRAWNTRDLDTYVAAISAGRPAEAGAEVLDEPTRAFEAMALGLRRVDGIGRDEFAAEFGGDPLTRFGEIDPALVETCDGRLRLTARGRLFASDACLAFLPRG